MMRSHFFKGFPLLLLCLSTICLADIQITTTINDVHVRGSHALAGSIFLDISADDFPDASPQHPVFLKLSLDNDGLLGETLVDQTIGNPSLNQPLFLAMILNSDSAILEAGPETVSIVRWVAGEDAIWLRVNQSTSGWISNGGLPTAPTENHSVYFRIGLWARLDAQELEDHDPTQLNLPFNTRNPNTNGNLADSVSTLICLDLSQSSLEISGIESLLGVDLLAYDETAQISPGVFGEGTLLPLINFSNARIGRGRDISCNIEAFQQPLRAGVTTNTVHFSMDCHIPGPNIWVDLHDGSYLTLEGDPSKGIGFLPGSAEFIIGGVSSGIETVDPSSAFVSNGKTLYSRLFLAWDAGTMNLANAAVDVNVQVIHGDSTQAPDIFWQWNLLNHDGYLDDAPFNGPQQGRRCEAYEIEAGSGLFQFVQAIPTLTTWGLLLFLALFMAAALWFLRKSRLTA